MFDRNATQTNVCNMNIQNVMHRSYMREYSYHVERARMLIQSTHDYMYDHEYVEQCKRDARANIERARIVRVTLIDANKCVCNHENNV